MNGSVLAARQTPSPPSIGRPPLPHEHGAWVILYAPALITMAALWPVAIAPCLLLLVAVTGIFLGRNAISMVLRKRADTGTKYWLTLYLIMAVAGTVPLLLLYHRTDLLFIGALAALLFGIHAILLLTPSRKRLDLSQWGEVLSVGALALTAPAAYAVALGHLDVMAWCFWFSCMLYFSSSIFFVKMLLKAVKIKGKFGWKERWQVGRDNVIYHTLVILIVASVTLVQHDLGAILSIVAYLPAVVRAFKGWATLTNKLPVLKRVGVGETLYSLWFIGFFLASLRVG